MEQERRVLMLWHAISELAPEDENPMRWAVGRTSMPFRRVDWARRIRNRVAHPDGNPINPRDLVRAADIFEDLLNRLGVTPPDLPPLPDGACEGDAGAAQGGGQTGPTSGAGTGTGAGGESGPGGEPGAGAGPGPGGGPGHDGAATDAPTGLRPVPSAPRGRGPAVHPGVLRSVQAARRGAQGSPSHPGRSGTAGSPARPNTRQTTRPGSRGAAGSVRSTGRPATMPVPTIALLAVGVLCTLSLWLALAGLPALVLGAVAMSKVYTDYDGAVRLTRTGWRTFIMLLLITLAGLALRLSVQGTLPF